MPAYHNRNKLGDIQPSEKADAAMPAPKVSQQEVEASEAKRRDRQRQMISLAEQYASHGAEYSELHNAVTVPWGRKRRVAEDEKTIRKLLKL